MALAAVTWAFSATILKPALRELPVLAGTALRIPMAGVVLWLTPLRRVLSDADVAAPRIEVRRAADRLELRARLALPQLVDAPGALGLSAVIEEASGAKSYWALAHPPGRPDFHHADGFAAELTPP